MIFCVLCEEFEVLSCFVKLLEVLLIYCNCAEYFTQEVGQNGVHKQGHEIEIEWKGESHR